MKLKTCKSALKRVKIKKNVLQRKKAYKAHFLRRKSSNHLTRLAKFDFIKKCDFKNFLKLVKNF